MFNQLLSFKTDLFGGIWDVVMILISFQGKTVNTFISTMTVFRRTPSRLKDFSSNSGTPPESASSPFR